MELKPFQGVPVYVLHDGFRWKVERELDIDGRAGDEEKRSARRCGATAGWRYFAARAPTPSATRARAQSARVSTVNTAVTTAPTRPPRR